MTRTLKSSVVLAAFSMLAVSPLLPACGSSDNTTDPQNAGDAQFRYVIADGVEVTSLHYVVSRPGQPDIEGDVPVGDSAVVTFAIDELPAGDDYHIVVTAVSDDGRANCDGEADFVILAGQRTQVDVIMSCVLEDEEKGGADVEVEINICPNLGSVTVTPSTQCVGEAVDLVAAATDLDGDALSYTWTVDGVAAGAGVASSYTCDSAGVKAVAVEVSDANCSDVHATSVTCEPCGDDDDDGDDDDGDDDDDDGDDDDGDDDDGDDDDGDDDDGDDDDDDDNGAIWDRGLDCDSCMVANCNADWGIDVQELCPVTDTECRDVLECGFENTCIDQTLASLSCYCGSVSDPTNCANSAYPELPDGECKGLIETSQGTTTREDIIAGWTSTSHGAGRAAIAAACMSQVCFDECVVTPE